MIQRLECASCCISAGDIVRLTKNGKVKKARNPQHYEDVLGIAKESANKGDVIPVQMIVSVPIQIKSSLT